MNARASGLVTLARRISLKFVALAAPLMAALKAPEKLSPVKRALITPIAPSFPTDEAINAIKSCHPRPNTLVTGSIACPKV